MKILESPQLKGTSYDHTGTLPPQFPGDDENLPSIPQLEPVDRSDVSKRGLPLQERHFRAIGYTDGCMKCRKMQRNERSTDGHSPACRERALRLLRESEEFKPEVERAERRIQEALAREIERTLEMEPAGASESNEAAQEVEEPAVQQHGFRNPENNERTGGEDHQKTPEEAPSSSRQRRAREARSVPRPSTSTRLDSASGRASAAAEAQPQARAGAAWPSHARARAARSARAERETLSLRAQKVRLGLRKARCETVGRL